MLDGTTSIAFTTLNPFFGGSNAPLGFNKYGFVHGNPVTGEDPTETFFRAAVALASMGVQSALRGMYKRSRSMLFVLAWLLKLPECWEAILFSHSLEALGDSFLDSMISCVPIAGSVYDFLQIAGFIPGLFGTIYDLTRMNSGSSTALSGASALSVPAPLLNMLHRGHLRLNKYFAKIWSKAKVHAIARHDGCVIPILGKAHNTTNTSGDPHAVTVLAQAIKIEAVVSTEFVTMNVALSTVLRVKGSAGIDSLFKELKGIDFSIPIYHRGVATSLARYKPDAVAILRNVWIIIEVASPSQMSGGNLMRSYKNQLVSIRDLAGETLPFAINFKVLDTNGIELAIKQSRSFP